MSKDRVLTADGHHIQLLLLTFFANFMPQLLEEGKVYCAIPPKYQYSDKTGIHYIRTEEEYQERLAKGEVFKEIHELKGLGSMEPEDLLESTFKSKDLYQQIKTVEDYEEIIAKMMGKDSKHRKEFIVKEGI